MEANKLMIGDWVQVPFLIDNVEHFNAYFQVKQLMDCDLDVIGFKELKYDEICPIPLTPEILEKNEFIKKEHRWILLDSYTKDKLIVLLNVANGFALLTTEGMTLGFQYVHELQHFYKLCGIHKEIIL